MPNFTYVPPPTEQGLDAFGAKRISPVALRWNMDAPGRFVPENGCLCTGSESHVISTARNHFQESNRVNTQHGGD